MKKMEFFLDYIVSALIVAAAFTKLLNIPTFIILFIIIYTLIYIIHGLRLDSLYFPPLVCLLIYGIVYENETIKMIVCGIIMMNQINSSKIHQLPVNNKIIGFKK
jgi:uncharacterized membrane protein YccC